MSRFSPCRDLTLEGVCRDCACDCAMRSHSLMRTTGPGCTETYIKGSNVLRDPGFESGGDSAAYPQRIPAVQSGNACDPDIQYDPDFSGPCGYTDTLGWGSDFDQHGPTFFRFWEHTTVDPQSGTYHVRTPDYPNSIEDGLYPVTSDMCIDGHNFGFYSAIVQPGDVWTWEVNAKRTGSVGQVDLEWFNFHYNSAGSIVTFPSGVFGTLTNSYQTFSVSAMVPANAHYLIVQAFANIVTTPDNGTRVYIDNASLVIS